MWLSALESENLNLNLISAIYNVYELGYISWNSLSQFLQLQNMTKLTYLTEG